MSTFPVVKAESVTLLAALETTFGVQATSNYQELQPNPDGIANYYPHITTKAPAPLSKRRQMEAPQIVDLDAAPGLTHDLTKDLMDRFVEGVMLAKTKHNGGTGVAYWSNALTAPTITARTTTAYTVTAGGALQAGTLVVPRGWVTGANAAANGTLQVVGASSTSTSIPVASGVAEAPAGAYTVTLEVAGFRGTSGDIKLDASGNLTSTTADFTTMGLQPLQIIWVGGTIGGGHDFATAAYRGFVRIATITTNAVTFSWRSWTPGAADTGTGQTIDLYWGRWIRNVAFDSADYQEPSYTFELSYPNLSGGTTTEFAYALGNYVDKLEINAALASLIVATLSFIGTTISDPTTSRATGASTAAAPLAIDRYNTTSRELYRRLQLQSDHSVVSDDIDTWKLMIMNHVTPQKQQGKLGAARMVVGKIEVSLDMSVFLTQDDAMKACSQNLTLEFGSGFRNNDGGLFVEVPSLKCTDAPPKFAGNAPVTVDLKLGAFRDATGNYTMALTLFPFLPLV